MQASLELENLRPEGKKINLLNTLSYIMMGV